MTLATRALATLDEALAIESPTPLQRDGTIQRFEYTYETVVRLCQQYLTQIEGASERNPKPIMRRLALSGVIAEDEARRAVEMVDDRNLTVHTYIEAVAERVHAALPGHTQLLARIVQGIAAKIGDQDAGAPLP